MMKVFVVMEIGWEYNDENYFRPEDGGGTPKVAYLSRNDAVLSCKDMNAKRLAQPHSQELVTEWDEDDPGYITEFYEVKEVKLVGE
jgi:hypothetical protein